MQEVSILHLFKDDRLVGVMTPDIMGMDHIVYPEGASQETQKEVMRILATVPVCRDIIERERLVKEAYEREGFVVNKILEK